MSKNIKRASEDYRNVSMFNILINTNKTKEEGASEEKLQHDVEKLAHNFIKLLKIVGDAQELGDNYKIKIRYDTEFGSDKNRLHAHMAVKIKHNTMLQINYKKLRAWAVKHHYPFVRAVLVKPERNENQEAWTAIKKYPGKTYFDKK